MKNTLLICALLLACHTNAAAQDDLFDSGLPKSKQAMLIVDTSLDKLMASPLMAPVITPDLLEDFGPPFEMETYRSIQRVTVFVGAPDLRGREVDFVTRLTVKDKTLIPKIAQQMFGIGREFETKQEDGWTVLKAGDRFLPGVIRYKDNLFEFGSTLYTYTPSRSLVSKPLAETFQSLDKDSELRIALDAQVLGAFFDSVMEMENAQEDAVYSMVKWGEFINESSVLLYGTSLLKDMKTASLSVNLQSETMAQLNIVPASGKDEIVKARAKVLHDFLMFHVNLPIKTLKEKENPVAGILEKLASGFKLSTEGDKIQLTMAKPKDLSKSFLAIVEKMRGSFAQVDDMNRMKQLGLAAHNYHDVMRRFPYTPNPNLDGKISKDLSWRVLIMPYMERYGEYDRLDLTQGWDAKPNQFVIDKCKDSFVMSNGALICSIKTEPPATKFSTILDGSSNTIMLIENRSATMTPWTKPSDLTIDQAVTLVTKLKAGDSLWVTMYDGSVWKLPSPKDSGATEKQLRNLFDPRDGNVTRTEDMLLNANPGLFSDIQRPRRGGFYGEAKKAVTDEVDFGKEAPPAFDRDSSDEKKEEIKQ